MSSMNAHDAIAVVRRAVASSVEQAHQVFDGDLIKFVLFFEGLLTETQPRHLLTSIGLDAVKAKLAIEEERDYLVTMDMLFHAHLADNIIIYKSLIDVLANSLSTAGFSPDSTNLRAPQSMFESDYLDRQKSYLQCKALLDSNKILVTILSYVLWGSRMYRIEMKKVPGGEVPELVLQFSRAEQVAMTRKE